MDVPRQNEYFEFPVKITELKASFTPGHLSSENYNDTLTYEATVTTSDYIAPEKVENTVTTHWKASGLKQEWIHNGNNHTLKIKNIAKVVAYPAMLDAYRAIPYLLPHQAQLLQALV